VDTELGRANDLLDERFFAEFDAFSAEEFVIFQHETLTVDDPAFAAAARIVVADLVALPGIDTAMSFFANEEEALVSADRRTTYVPVSFHDDPADEIEGMQAVFAANATDGLRILTVGEGSRH